MSTLPQEFPRDLVLLKLEDVLPGLPPGARKAYTVAFEERRSDPLSARGLLLAGPGGLRPLMALMRLVVLRFRDLNFERFEDHGGAGRYLSAYVKGDALPLPLPERANALFIERADLAPADAAEAITAFGSPVFATWEGSRNGPVWEALAGRSNVISLDT